VGSTCPASETPRRVAFIGQHCPNPRFHPWCLLSFPPLITRSFVAQGGDEAARRPLRSCTVCSRVPWRQGSWQTANLYLDGTWISAAV